MNNDNTTGVLTSAAVSADLKQETDAASAPVVESTTVVDIGCASGEVTVPNLPAHDAAPAEPVEEGPDACEHKRNLVWLIVQCASIALLCASICFSMANFVMHGTLPHVLKRCNLKPYSKDTEEGEQEFGLFDYLFLISDITLLFSKALGFKGVIALISTHEQSNDIQEFINPTGQCDCSISREQSNESDSWTFIWPDLAIYIVFAMAVALVTMLRVVTGRKRHMRSRVFAFVFLIAQLPEVSLLVDLLCNQKKLSVHKDFGSMASPSAMLALYGTTCGVQLAVAVCAFFGLLLNGTPAAGYFTSYYHVRRPAVTV